MDREKVIHAAETAFDVWIDEYTGCSWFKEDEVRQAKEDAIALLKEQEAVKRTCRKGINGFSIIWTCGACGSDLYPNNTKAKFCSNCGRAVK